MRNLRMQAVGCALLFTFCELISRPFAEIGIADDWSYVRTAQLLAQTGHIVYNGWATAIIGWQLYLAAAIMRFSGSSFSSARASTIIVGALTGFLIQRTLVRAGISERNATVSTLAIIISPLYMLLSATYMTDIPGLFGIVVCLYCCIRAVQSVDEGTAIRWLWLAGLLNIIVGSSRQIAWLGVLMIVPSTVWLLREKRRLLWNGLIVVVIGASSVAWSMHWFQEQRYSLPESALPSITSMKQVLYVLRQLLRGAFEVPFLVVALAFAFFAELRRNRWLIAVLSFSLSAFALVAVLVGRHHGRNVLLEPLLSDWISPQGFYDIELAGQSPTVLTTGLRVVLTGLTVAFVICLGSVIFRIVANSHDLPLRQKPNVLTWHQIGVLLGPFSIAYAVLLVPRATGNLRDRYLLEFVLVAVLILVRLSQDFVQPKLPKSVMVVVACIGTFSVAATHDMFSLSRARLEIAEQMTAVGVPDNNIDGGFEWNGWVELQRGGHINDERLVNPPHSFVQPDSSPEMVCNVKKNKDPGLLHFTPMYGIAWQKDACHGAAPFAPVRYSRWLAFRPANLYVVKYGNFDESEFVGR